LGLVGCSTIFCERFWRIGVGGSSKYIFCGHGFLGFCLQKNCCGVGAHRAGVGVKMIIDDFYPFDYQPIAILSAGGGRAELFFFSFFFLFLFFSLVLSFCQSFDFQCFKFCFSAF